MIGVVLLSVVAWLELHFQVVFMSTLLKRTPHIATDCGRVILDIIIIILHIISVL